MKSKGLRQTAKPKPQRRDGRPSDKAIRWNLNQAAREFGKPRESLAIRQRALCIDPGEDGCFSSQQIAAMIFGDKEAETIGKLAAERRNVELANARLAGEVMPTVYVAALAERILIPIRQKICTSGMSDAEKDELLSDLLRLEEMDWPKEARDAVRRRH